MKSTMLKRTCTMWLTAGLLVCAVATAEEGKMASTTLERGQVDVAHTWNLADLYANQAAWEKDLARLERELKGFSKCQGTFNKGAKQIGACLDKQYSLVKRLYRLNGYADRLHHQDMGGILGQELHTRISKVATQVTAAMAFVEPEILALSPKKLKGMLKAKALSAYKHTIANVIRRRDHVRGRDEEQIIAQVGDLAGVPQNIYQTFSTLNLPFAEIKLKNGEMVRLSQAMYTKFRAAPDREDRIKVFQAFWGTYKKFRETYAGLLAGAVNRDHYYAQVRKYDSDLASALDGTNVPTAIYTNMITQIKGQKTLLWRYLKLRKKLLGLESLGYHDLYSSMVPSVEMKIDWKAGQALMSEALAPLGKEYGLMLNKCFDGRWTDVYPTKGKRPGAYMAGSAYDVHPYVLLNYNDDYESVSTAAHEYGHAGHSYLANKHQPFHLSRYPIFVAEVASTANENLLRLYVTEREKDEKKKLFLIGQYLESWRQTVFRQCLFAEFELKIHELAAEGKPLTADALDKLYLSLLREYYGEAEGVTSIDPLYATEWAYIPHFYYNFYMFQYTTSFIASTAVANKIYAGDDKARVAYLSMLKAGGSKYPVDLLKMAGVDMTTAEPYKVAFKALEQALNEAEKLTQ